MLGLNLPDPPRTIHTAGNAAHAGAGVGRALERVQAAHYQRGLASGQSQHTLPVMTPDLFYLLGLVASDGSLDWQGPQRCRVNFTNKATPVCWKPSPNSTTACSQLPRSATAIRRAAVLSKVARSSTSQPSADLYSNNFVLGLLAETFGRRMQFEIGDNRAWDLARMVNLPESSHRWIPGGRVRWRRFGALASLR